MVSAHENIMFVACIESNSVGCNGALAPPHCLHHIDIMRMQPWLVYDHYIVTISVKTSNGETN